MAAVCCLDRLKRSFHQTDTADYEIKTPGHIEGDLGCSQIQGDGA